MSLHVQLENVTKVFQVDSSATGELVAAMSATSDRNASDGGKVAIDHLSLSIAEGDRLGIVGRNGAGKSTLLHMIAGISNPTSGSIHINGKVTSIMTLGVGLRDDLSGRENIYVDGEIQGKSRIEVDDVIEEVIAFSELGKFIDYPVRTYSTGMKARLAFSMISHIDPEILIIDEALSVGDASFSAKATARILEICARGKIVILVSHGMQSVRDICNRCIYIKDGKVVMDGTPEEVTKVYIDEVRGEDEAVLMKRFAAHVGKFSHRVGNEILRVDLHSEKSQVATLRVEALKRLRIQVRGRVESQLMKDALCRMRIVRLDDLLVFDQIFQLSSFSEDEADIGVEVEFDPLILGPAIYRLDVMFADSARNAESMIAEYAMVFEVYSLSPPHGGKPMLYYPVAATTVSAT